VSMSGRNVCIALLMLACLTGASAAQVIDLDTEPTKEFRPEIWTKASAADVKKAENAARADACLRLVEAVYRLPVSSERDVYDMMLRNETVNAELIRELGKAKAFGGDYLEDGTVRVRVATTPIEVSRILKKAYEKVDWADAEEDAVIAAVGYRMKRDTQVLAEGEGALPKSPGARHIPVRRAALTKASQRIVLEILRMIIGHQDDEHAVTVRDFALAVDTIPRKIALGLSDVRIRDETWANDGSVEMRAELNAIAVTDLVRRGQALHDKRGKWSTWAFGHLINYTRDMILHAEVKATTKDRAPKDAPLAIELEAVDQAIKISPKDK